MDRLPSEIVAEIATYLPESWQSKRTLPGLATLSRSWQYAVESITFKSLSISSHDLEAFCGIFASHTPRRTFLRRLVVDIVLPPCCEDHRDLHETAEDRSTNDHVFNHQLSTLLKELSEWPAGGKLELEIATHSPMDLHRLGDEELWKIGYSRHEDDLGRRYRHSYIRLTKPLTVVVPCITRFHALLGPRDPDPGSLVALTGAFPNIERINWFFRDPICFLPHRRQLMQELTRAVASFKPPSSCKTLKIYTDSRDYPPGERLPDLISDNNSFCGSLCALLGQSNIQRFSYTGLIDPTLFWPQESPETDKGPSPWSSLQEMKVFFEKGSLAGQWFFKGRPEDPYYDESSDVPLSHDAAGFLPPGYYDNDEQNNAAEAHAPSWLSHRDFVRCIPRDEAILPLLKAVARRLAHTPSLRRVCLESRRRWWRGIWCFRYYAPGESSRRDDQVDREELGCGDPVSRARVFLHADDWRPDEEVLALLRRVGRACNGKDAIVTFLPFLY